MFNKKLKSQIDGLNKKISKLEEESKDKKRQDYISRQVQENLINHIVALELKGKEIKNCPYCHAAPEAYGNLYYSYSEKMGVKTEEIYGIKYVVACRHERCGVTPRVVSMSLDDAVNKWNNR